MAALKKTTPSSRISKSLPTHADVDTSWFRNLLADCDITQRKLADALGRHPAAVTLLLQGRRRMLSSEASIISRLTGAPLSEILARAGIEVPRSPSSIPVELDADDQGAVRKAPAGPRMTLRAPSAPEMTSRATVVRWNGRGPESGWILYFDAAGAGVPPEAIGRVCLVTVKGMPGQYVRVVKNGYKAGRFNLEAWPGAIEAEAADGVALASAAPLRWVRAA